MLNRPREASSDGEKVAQQSQAEDKRAFARTLGIAVSKILVVVFASWVFASDWTGDDGYWRSWIAMAVFWTIAATSKPLAATGYGLLMGILSLGAAFWWAQEMLAYVMNVEGWLPTAVFAGLITWESLIFAAVAFSISWWRKRRPQDVGFVFPLCLWIAAEAFQPRVFRWALSHSQLGEPSLVQTVELGGACMATFLVLAVAAMPSLLWDWLGPNTTPERRQSARRVLYACLSIVALTVGFGLYKTNKLDLKAGQPFSLGVVQEDPESREGLNNMRQRSLSLGPVDLLVWPESTLGVHSNDLDSFADENKVLDFSKPPMINPQPLVGLPAPVVLGGRSFNGSRDSESPVFQTAFLVASDGSIQARYHKRSLMPLGEYVPGEKSFPWLHDLFQLGEYFEPGTSDAPIEISSQCKIGLIICYEDTMASVVRSTVVSGAGLLVCIINDSAFASPIALQQHMKLSRLRAIENRRYLVRSAGTGVSCVIDPLGTVTQRLDPDESGAFEANVRLRDDKTLFQYVGQWPPWVALVLLFALAIRLRLTSS